MPQAFDGIATDVEQLAERLHNLEERVAALEAQRTTQPQRELAEIALQRPRPPATWRGFPPAEMPAGVVPVLGKAVLGIAGAYLLRAIAGSGVVPKFPVLIVAMVYAGLWMVWAVRTHALNRFASISYGITSALILSPLLWESTVRFRVLSPAFTSVVLVAFVVLALFLSWKRDLQVIPWVGTVAAVATAVALIIATRELVPFTAALLAVALAMEIAVCMGHRLSVRAVPAIAADFTIWLLIDVMTSPQGVPEGYRPASAAAIIVVCLALLAIYGGSIVVRNFGFRDRLSMFEIAQVVVAFVLAAFGVMRATQGSAAPFLALLFLAVAAVCYWGALSRFADNAGTRNRRVCAIWAAALLLAGSFLLFSPKIQVPFLCVAAIAAVQVYRRTAKISLGVHASCYLAAATAVSPLPTYAENALAGTVPASPDWRVWVVAASAAVCYAAGARLGEEERNRRLLWVIPAALVGFTSAVLAVVAIVWLAAGRVELAASTLSVIRTVVNCALALTFAFLGSHWKRLELGWVAYAAVVFGTLKLLFEDLRFGNAASLVASLLFYGLILIVLPRLTRHRGAQQSST